MGKIGRIYFFSLALPMSDLAQQVHGPANNFGNCCRIQLTSTTRNKFTIYLILISCFSVHRNLLDPQDARMLKINALCLEQSLIDRNYRSHAACHLWHLCSERKNIF